MYGMVQLGLEQMVVARYGPAAWHDIRDAAGQRGVEFVSNESYPDEVSYALVGATAEQLDLTGAELLEQFGRYWVADFAVGHYGPLLDACGDDVGTFIASLNNLHVRVGLVFPGYQPPRFEVTDATDHSLRLHYFSHREGLAPFVVGLLSGIGDRFGQVVTTTVVAAKSDGADHDEFEVSWQPVPVA